MSTRSTFSPRLFTWVRPGSPLFRMPSFWDGVASIADPWGKAFTEFRSSDCISGPHADLEALKADWAAVAGDLRAAMGLMIREQRDRRPVASK